MYKIHFNLRLKNSKTDYGLGSKNFKLWILLLLVLIDGQKYEP